MIREHYLLLLILAGAVTLSIRLQGHPSADTSASTATSPVPGYDQFIDRPRWTNWDSRGQAAYYLTAVRLEHYPERQGSILEQAMLRTVGQDPRWSVTAQQAFLPDRGQPVQLDRQVVARVERGGAAERILKTEQLMVDTALNLAYNDVPVRIESNSGIVTGNGMHADLHSHRIELHQQVRSRHEDNPD